MKRVFAASAAIVAAAALVRLAAAGGDFWFDEIWSWSIARTVKSPWSILTEIRHDNNHYLNTLVVWLLGSEKHWFVYRLPAVIAGTGSVVLAGRIAGSRRVVDGLAAMVLVGSSYLCILLTTEARGYAYVVFFSLLAVLVQQRALERPGRALDLSLAATLILGVLSHLTFLYCWASLLAWALVRTFKGRGSWSSLIASHLPPIGFCAWLYAVNIHEMTIGGGEMRPPGEAILGAMSLFLGGPEAGPVAWVFAVAGAVLLIAGLVRLYRSGSDEWIFYAGTLWIAPLLLTLVARHELYVRYFLVAVVFGLLLAARLLGDLWSRGRATRVAFGAILALFVILNALPTGRLVRIGRGRYETALQQIREESRVLPGAIGSDHDLRNGLLFMYYRRRLPDRELHFHTRRTWPESGPEWFIRHSLDRSWRPEAGYADPWGGRYRLARVYPHAGLSGWSWAVYRNERFLED